MSIARIIAKLVERGEEDLAEELLQATAKIPVMAKVNIPVTEKLDSGELQALAKAALSALSKYKPHSTEKDVLKKVDFSVK